MNRTWIYQAQRPLTAKEEHEIAEELKSFVARWAAHNHKLDARFEIVHSHFIILTVNEDDVIASGCSIDDSVHFIQSIDRKYSLDLFNRAHMAYVNADGGIRVCHLSDIAGLYKDHTLTNDTQIFNNTIQDAALLATEWKVPLGKSGFAAFI